MDNLLFKSGNSGQVNIDEAQGIVECFVAGIGNKDSVGDVVISGAFAKSLTRRKPRVVWGHSWNDPIGKVLEMYEVPVGDSRLPAKMRNAGIGGLYAKVQFNLNSEKGKEAFATVAFFGEEQEWSIGYKTIDSVFDPNLQANILKEVELYEVSPVLHGANQLTGTISIKGDEKGHMPIIPMPGMGMQMMPEMPRIVVIASPQEEENEASEGNPFDEGMAQELQQPDKMALQAELTERTGSKIEVMNATENSVVFRRTTADGKASMYRLPYHKEGNQYMFGKPEPYAAANPSPQAMQNVEQKPDAPVVVPNGGIAYRTDDQAEMAMLFAGENAVQSPWGKSDVSHLIELPESYMASAKDFISPVLRHHKLIARPNAKGIVIDGLLTANALDALQNAVKALGATLGQTSGNIGQAIGKIRDLAQTFNPYALDGDGDGFVQDGSAFQRPYIPVKKPGFDLPDVRGRRRSGDALLDKPRSAPKLPKDKNTWSRAQRNDALLAGVIDPETREDVAFLANRRPENEGIAKYWDMSEADLTKEGNRLVNARRQATGADKEKIDEELLKVSHEFQRRASYAETFGQEFVPPAKREAPEAMVPEADKPKPAKPGRTEAEGLASAGKVFDALNTDDLTDGKGYREWDDLSDNEKFDMFEEVQYDYLYDRFSERGDDGLVDLMESGDYDDEILEHAEEVYNKIKAKREEEGDRAADAAMDRAREEDGLASRGEDEPNAEELAQREADRALDEQADAALDRAIEGYIEKYGDDDWDNLTSEEQDILLERGRDQARGLDSRGERREIRQRVRERNALGWTSSDGQLIDRAMVDPDDWDKLEAMPKGEERQKFIDKLIADYNAGDYEEITKRVKKIRKERGLLSRGEGEFGSNEKDSAAAKAFDSILEKYWKMWGFDVPGDDEEGWDEPFGFASRGNDEEVKQSKLDELVGGVKDRLIAELETADPATWKPSWRNDSLPINPTTGKPYKGWNAFFLMLSTHDKQYKTGRFAGFNQLKARGAIVRKGEKGTPILRPQLVRKEDEDGNIKEFVVFRGATVFNIDQTDGGDDALRAIPADLPESERIAILDETLKELGVNVRTDNMTPHYNPEGDYISMPDFAKGTSALEWTSTLAHEAVHWTGHKSRLDRPSLRDYSSDKKIRAYEELVAEIGSAMLLAAHGIEAPFRQDHAPYIKGWIQLLKDDPEALNRAFKDAQAAVNHMLEKSPNLRKLFGGIDTGKKAPDVDAPDKAEALVGASEGFASLHRVRTPGSSALGGILYDDNSNELMVGFLKGKSWDDLSEGEREDWIERYRSARRGQGGYESPLDDTQLDERARDFYEDSRDIGWYVYSDVSMEEVSELAAARSKGRHINALKKLKKARKASDEDQFNFFGRDERVQDVKKSDGFASVGTMMHPSYTRDSVAQWWLIARSEGARGRQGGSKQYLVRVERRPDGMYVVKKYFGKDENQPIGRLQSTVEGPFRDYAVAKQVGAAAARAKMPKYLLMYDNIPARDDGDGFASRGVKKLGIEPRYQDRDWISSTQERILKSGLDFQSLPENDRIDWANSFLNEYLNENEMGHGLSDVANGRRLNTRPDIELLNYAEMAYARMSDAHASRRAQFGEKTEGLSSVGRRTRRLGIKPSQAVDYVSYDPESENLYVAYKREDGRGDMYVYEGVSMDDAIGIENAESVGKAINDIKRRKNVRKATPDEIIGLSDSDRKEANRLKRATAVNMANAVFANDEHRKNRNIQLEINADRISVEDDGTTVWESADDTMRYTISPTDDGGYLVSAEKLSRGGREEPDTFETVFSSKENSQDDAITALFNAAKAKIADDDAEARVDRELDAMRRELDTAGDAPGVESVDVTYSSALDAVDYNPSTQELRVSYKDGGTYVYEGVDRITFEEFKSAPSKGRAMNDIKRAHPYRKDSEWTGGGDEDGGIEEFDVRGSEAVEKVTYDPSKEELTVVYSGGKGYIYSGVTREEADAVRSAPSKGRAINDVKRTHDVRKMPTEVKGGPDLEATGWSKGDDGKWRKGDFSIEVLRDEKGNYTGLLATNERDGQKYEQEAAPSVSAKDHLDVFEGILRGVGSLGDDDETISIDPAPAPKPRMATKKPPRGGKRVRNRSVVIEMEQGTLDEIIEAEGKNITVDALRDAAGSPMGKYTKGPRKGKNRGYDTITVRDAETGELLHANEILLTSSASPGSPSAANRKRGYIRARSYAGRQGHQVMKDEGPSLRGEGRGMTDYDKRVYGLGSDEKNREAGLASRGGGNGPWGSNMSLDPDEDVSDSYVEEWLDRHVSDGNVTLEELTDLNRIESRRLVNGKLEYGDSPLTDAEVEDLFNRYNSDDENIRQVAENEINKIFGDTMVDYHIDRIRDDAEEDLAASYEYERADARDRYEDGFASRGQRLGEIRAQERAGNQWIEEAQLQQPLEIVNLEDDKAIESFAEALTDAGLLDSADDPHLDKIMDRILVFAPDTDEGIMDAALGYGSVRYVVPTKDRKYAIVEMTGDYDGAPDGGGYSQSYEVVKTSPYTLGSVIRDVQALERDEKNREAGLASRGSDLKRNLQARLDDMISRQEALDTSTPEGRREWEKLEESIGILDDRILGMGEGQVARDDDGFASGRYRQYESGWDSVAETAQVTGRPESSTPRWADLDDDQQNEFIHEVDYDYMYDNHGELGDDGIVDAMESGRYDDEINEHAEMVWDTIADRKENQRLVRALEGTNANPEERASIAEYWSNSDALHDRYMKQANGNLGEAMNLAYEDHLSSLADMQDDGFASQSDRPLTTQFEWTRFEDLDAAEQDRIIKDHIDSIDRAAQPDIDLEAEREFAIEQWNDDARAARAKAAESLLTEINELWDQDADADNPFQRNGNLAYAEELIKNTDYVEDLELAEAQNIVNQVRERFEGRERESGDGLASRGGDDDRYPPFSPFSRGGRMGTVQDSGKYDTEYWDDNALDELNGRGSDTTIQDKIMDAMEGRTYHEYGDISLPSDTELYMSNDARPYQIAYVGNPDNVDEHAMYIVPIRNSDGRVTGAAVVKVYGEVDGDSDEYGNMVGGRSVYADVVGEYESMFEARKAVSDHFRGDDGLASRGRDLDWAESRGENNVQWSATGNNSWAGRGNSIYTIYRDNESGEYTVDAVHGYSYQRDGGTDYDEEYFDEVFDTLDEAKDFVRQIDDSREPRDDDGFASRGVFMDDGIRLMRRGNRDFLSDEFSSREYRDAMSGLDKVRNNSGTELTTEEGRAIRKLADLYLQSPATRGTQREAINDIVNMVNDYRLGRGSRGGFASRGRSSTKPTVDADTQREIEGATLGQLAQMIQDDLDEQGKEMYFGAVPYIEAMATLETMDDKYGYDDAESIVAYALGNLQTYKGPKARAIKAELKKRLDEKFKRNVRGGGFASRGDDDGIASRMTQADINDMRADMADYPDDYAADMANMAAQDLQNNFARLSADDQNMYFQRALANNAESGMTTEQLLEEAKKLAMDDRRMAELEREAIGMGQSSKPRKIDVSSSSALNSVEYDEMNQRLSVEYRGRDGKGTGILYNYDGVSPEVVDRIAASSSRGSTMREIRDNYEFTTSRKLPDSAYEGLASRGRPAPYSREEPAWLSDARDRRNRRNPGSGDFVPGVDDEPWVEEDFTPRRPRRRTTGYVSGVRNGGTVAPGARPATAEGVAPSVRLADDAIAAAKTGDSNALRNAIEEARRSNQTIRFSYNGKEREIIPLSIQPGAGNGRYNLVGQDLQGVRKNFSLDKMSPSSGDGLASRGGNENISIEKGRNGQWVMSAMVTGNRGANEENRGTRRMQYTVVGGSRRDALKAFRDYMDENNVSFDGRDGFASRGGRRSTREMERELNSLEESDSALGRMNPSEVQEYRQKLIDARNQAALEMIQAAGLDPKKIRYADDISPDEDDFGVLERYDMAISDADEALGRFRTDKSVAEAKESAAARALGEAQDVAKVVRNGSSERRRDWDSDEEYIQALREDWDSILGTVDTFVSDESEGESLDSMETYTLEHDTYVFGEERQMLDGMQARIDSAKTEDDFAQIQTDLENIMDGLVKSHEDRYREDEAFNDYEAPSVPDEDELPSSSLMDFLKDDDAIVAAGESGWLTTRGYDKPDGFASRGRRRPGRRNQGRKRQGMAPKTRYTDEERQAIADGNILKSRRRPSKRRGGPDASEWDGFASVGTLDDSDVMTDPRGVFEGGEHGPGKDISLRKMWESIRRSGENNEWFDESMTAEKLAQDLRIPRNIAQGLLDARPQSGRPELFIDDPYLADDLSQRIGISRTRLFGFDPLAYYDDQGNIADTEEQIDAAIASERARRAARIAAREGRRTGKANLYRNEAGNVDVRVLEGILNVKLTDDNGNLLNPSALERVTRDTGLGWAGEKWRRIHSRGGALSPLDVEELVKRGMLDRALLPQRDDKTFGEVFQWPGFAGRPSNEIVDALSEVLGVDRQEVMAQRRSIQEALTLAKNNTRKAVATRNIRQAKLKLSRAKIKELIERLGLDPDEFDAWFRGE